MPLPLQADCDNRLPALMSKERFASLAPHLEHQAMKKKHLITGAGGVMGRFCFPEGCIASVVARSPEGLEIEANLFGREGYGPLPAVLGSDRSPNRVGIQAPDGAHLIDRPALVEAVDRSASPRGLLLRFAQVHTVQANCTALSEPCTPSTGGSRAGC